MLRFTTLAVACLAPMLAAQAVVVDYPDSTLGAAAGQYPIYTGTGLNVIRGQSFCPGTFAGLPATPMLCTRIGVQLAASAGPVPYAQFVLRAGSTTVPNLTATFATNLPDQRVQLDLSGTSIDGGPTTNVWVEWPLQVPFYYNPGDGVVIDFVTQAAVAGNYLRTCIGAGVQRCVSLSYTGGPSGSAITSGGIKFRMVFEPVGMVQWGDGCPGAGNITPTIAAMGQSNLGSQNLIVTLNNALGGTAAVFTLGFPASIDLGGGCHIYNTALATSFQATGGSGPGVGSSAFFLPIPNNPTLAGFVADVQWVVLDPLSAAVVPVVTTAGGKLVVY